MAKMITPKYVWTAEAEARAKEKGLKPRKEGQPALYEGEFIEKYGSITKDWLDKGYIRLSNNLFTEVSLYRGRCLNHCRIAPGKQ